MINVTQLTIVSDVDGSARSEDDESARIVGASGVLFRMYLT